MDMIATKMVIPLIQGALRYVYRSDPNGPLQSSTTKDRAEGWAFTAAVLPLINQCNSIAANEIEENMIWNAPSALTDGYQFTKRQFESVYECLGITCADVGGLIGADGQSFAPGMEPCVDTLAGYNAKTNVVPHSKIDLDQRDLEVALSNGDFAEAYRAYSQGGNSFKSGGTIRTIKGFSTGAAKMAGKALFSKYQLYWGSIDYADRFTSAACLGTGELAGAPEITRKELCKKGSAYQNIWMYTVWEMEDAIDDCVRNDISYNGGSVHAWDEAWAFYAGSLEGKDGSGSGRLTYALAEKRCSQFGTCVDGTQRARVNDEIITLFNRGQQQIIAGQCDAAAATKDEIINKMTVPLLQGALRYVYRADPENGVSDAKQVAEGWAFTAAVLPQVHFCDANTARMIRENMIWNSANNSPVADGYVKVKTMFESVYSCMNIKCSDVGEFQENGVVFPGMEACKDPALEVKSDEDNDDLSASEIFGIVFAIVVILLVVAAGMFYFGKRAERYTKFKEEEQKGEYNSSVAMASVAGSNNPNGQGTDVV
eukprot:jgi/Bigna1/133614/aug1.22_g8322